MVEALLTLRGDFNARLLCLTVLRASEGVHSIGGFFSFIWTVCGHDEIHITGDRTGYTAS
jgi:hypothetical protein